MLLPAGEGASLAAGVLLVPCSRASALASRAYFMVIKAAKIRFYLSYNRPDSRPPQRSGSMTWVVGVSDLPFSFSVGTSDTTFMPWGVGE